MHWRDPLAESSDPHLASKSHPQASFGWHGTWPEEASSLGLNSMGSIKAAAAPRHQLDAFHSAGLDQDHTFHAAAAAAGAVHSPLASSPAHSNTAAGSAAAKRHSNSIDGALLNQLLLQTPADSRSNLHSKASAPSQQQQLLQQLRMPHNSHAHMYDSSALTPPAPGDWRLGTDVQFEPAAAPELQELLSQFPASQHKVLLDSLMASTNPQELLLTLQAAAATDTLGSPLHSHQQQHAAFDHGSTLWMQRAMAAAGTSPRQHNGIADLLLHPNTPTAPNSGNHLLQQLQLQASLAAQQAAMSSSVPAAAASSVSAAQQQLLLQQLQSVAAAANNPGALAQLLQQQMYGHGHSNSAAANNLWNNLAAAGLGTSPAAAAAALAAQQQQQSAMSAFMAQAALAQQRQQQHSSMMAAGQYYQQLAAQLMANQLAAASGPSSYASLAASSFGSLASSSAPSRAGSAGFGSMRDGMPGSFQRAASGFTKGRRNSRALSSSGSSRANSAGLSGSVDVFGYLGSSSGGSSRASSYAGSDMETAADSAAAALAAGLTLQDLCPASFQETWGAAATASNSSGVSSASSDAASSSWDSSSGAASPASSTSSKSASPAVTADTCNTAASQQQQQKGAAANDAVKVSSKKDQRVAPAATAVGDASCKQQRQLAKVGGCPVWFPGAREASGDDSWYLGCPPTCRLFVGNIGSWVDEDALLGYFGKYGNVVDVQVGCYCCQQFAGIQSATICFLICVEVGWLCSRSSKNTGCVR
jgi:hypothetical protein